MFADLPTVAHLKKSLAMIGSEEPRVKTKMESLEKSVSIEGVSNPDAQSSDEESDSFSPLLDDLED